MATFMLRNIDPTFWTRVRAKAASEGVSVKTVILRLLAAWLAIVFLFLSLGGCSYHSPTAATPPAAAAAVPTSITLSATAGFGNSAGTVFLIAQVTDAAGHGVSVPVSFTTSAGTMQPATMTADSSGQAQTRVLTSTAAIVTATAESAVGSISVTPIAAVVIEPLPPSQLPIPPPPTPEPPSSAPPSVPVPAAFVNLAPITTTVGAATLFSVGVYMPGGIAIVSTRWDFGDGGTASSSGATSHTYNTAGAFVARVSATDTLGRSASSSAFVVVQPVPTVIPPPAPVPALTATLTASPNARTVQGGTLDFEAIVSNLDAKETITSYQWDQDNLNGFEATTFVNTRTSLPYPTQGLYTAKVLVTTSTGRTVTASVGVVVTN